MNPEDLLAELPPPIDDEPSSLRRDIADELGDHLACAFHRELVKTADEQTAKDRVLDRFGDPRRIARQLWWQAMWSRIMLQRISIGLQSVLVATLLLLVGLLMQSQRQQEMMQAEAAALRQQTAINQQMLSQLVEQLRDVDLPKKPAPPGGMAGMMGAAESGGSAMMGAAAGGMGTMGAPGMPAMGMAAPPGFAAASPLLAGGSSLSLVLTMETEDGPPAESCVVGILNDSNQPLSQGFGISAGIFTPPVMPGMGSAMGSPGANLQTVSASGYQLWPGQQGRLDARPIDPGRYTVVIEFPNGWFAHHKIVVRPGEQHVEKIVCPKLTEKAFVTITAPPLPEDLQSHVARPDGTRESGTQLCATMKRSPEVKGRVKWNLMAAPPRELHFDPATGQLTLVMETSAEDPSSSRERDSFRDELPEERFLVLPTGRYELALAINRDVPVEPPLFRVDQLAALGNPSPGDAWRPACEFDVKPGQNTWTLDRAAELFEPARKELAELKENAAAKPAAEPPNQPLPPAADPAMSLRINARPASPYGGGLQGAVYLNVRDDGQGRAFRTTGRGGPGGLKNFGVLPAGQYGVTFEDPSGMICSTSIDWPGRSEQPLELNCPVYSNEAGWLHVSTPPLPEDLQQQGYCVQVDLRTAPKVVDGREWMQSETVSLRVLCDPRTGLAERSRISFSDTRYQQGTSATTHLRVARTGEQIEHWNPQRHPDDRHWMSVPTGSYRVVSLHIVYPVGERRRNQFRDEWDTATQAWWPTTADQPPEYVAKSPGTIFDLATTTADKKPVDEAILVTHRITVKAGHPTESQIALVPQLLERARQAGVAKR